MVWPRPIDAASAPIRRSAAKSSSAKPTESKTVTSPALRRPGAWPLSTSQSSVTGKSAAICCRSPSTRLCGSYSTNTLAASSTPGCSSVLPGQSPPTAFRCIPGASMSGVMMVALRLSAVTVVTMSAPCSASAVLVQTTAFKPGTARRWRCNFAVAAGSVSNRRSVVMPSRWWKASAWNSLCAPLPISAMVREPGRASSLAAITEVAAVRMAVVSVSSLSSSGLPVATSASTPKAITVGKPKRPLAGWPFTYLKL